jgi:hypothetical protein
VINLDQIQDDVVQKARQYRFFLLALLERIGRALKDVRGRRKTMREEIEDRRSVRHRRERHHAPRLAVA